MLQIVVEDAGLAVLNQAERALHRQGCNWQTAGHRFEHDEAECVGSAWKHEHVCGMQVCQQVAAELVPEKTAVRITPLQARPVGPVADDHLGAGQVELQEAFKCSMFFCTETRPTLIQIGPCRS